MTNLISGVGFSAQLVASVTFPNGGLTITEFADDADPFDIGEQIIGETAMGIGASLIVWSKANPIVITLNIVPNSLNDQALGILFEANRPSQGKIVANDIITLTAVYTDGHTITYDGGWCTSGYIGQGITSAQRMKSKMYVFNFQSLSVA